ncbi:hypothetical protein O7626_39895 [Micromonospora sp. WMMD1102]|uniref:hypothetical protein n=1 Tax=Micromonospora sp. WMMD1102 TaxID=3016105 RepID=UPI0024152929|nr:hypothetical protein [Micromonospora sp. WMMD1102]MDG4791979.1 hypothetical protein [Micromonospora sp. WMMD1102]
MGIDLITEVLFHAPEDLTPAERVVLLVIAEEANDGTRRGWPGRDALMHRSGLGKTGLARVFARLAERDLEVRLAIGTDSKGQPVYAFRGQQTQYQLPKLCPLPKHDRQGCRKGGLTATHSQVETVPEPVQPPVAAPEPERVAPGLPIEAERVAAKPPFPEQWVAPEPPINPERVAGVKERVAPRPPLPLISPQESSPQSRATVKPKWLTDDTQAPAKTVPINAPHASQSALFSAAALKLTEREQIIFDWLRWNDYPDAIEADAKAIDKILRLEFAGKGVGYLRGIAKPDGSGFGAWYQRIRRERAEKVDQQIKELERTEPTCEHGSLAGRALHPTYGTPLCAQCRAGVPATPDEPTTPAPVTAALDAFRSAHSGHLATYELILITQQITALHAAGATEQQLVTVAVTAAKAGVGILAAAARKDS